MYYLSDFAASITPNRDFKNEIFQFFATDIFIVSRFRGRTKNFDIARL